MNRYQNNAFRILGLSSDASMKDIMQRVNEVKVKKSLGVEVSYDFDFPWMGSIDRSEQNVINALQRLENSIFRLKEEIFWFWIETDTDREALECLVKKDRQGAHDLWKELIASNIPEEKKISAYANQIILAHSSVVGKEMVLSYRDEPFEQTTMLLCPKCNLEFKDNYRFCIYCGDKLKIKDKNDAISKRNVRLTDAHWTNWRFAINRILLVSSQEAFWTMVRKKAKRINDPRLSEAKLTEIRGSFLQDVTAPNLTFIAQSLASKDYERTGKHSSLLNGSSLPSETLRDGFNRVLSSRVALINRHCKNADKEIAALKKRTKRSIESMVNIYTKLEKDVSETVKAGNMVDINCVSDFGLARDTLSGSIRNIAIVLNNRLIAEGETMSFATKKWAYKKAFEMIKKSLRYAASQYTKENYRKDEDLIRANMKYAYCYDSRYEKDISDIEEEKYKVKGKQADSVSSSEKKQDYHQKSPATSSSWKPILIWGGIILFFIIVGNLPEDSSSDKSTSAKTASYSSQDNETFNAYELKSMIDSISTSMREKEAELAALEVTMKSKAEAIEKLRKEAETLQSRVERAWFGKGRLEDEYNQVVDNHNAALATYERDYNKYQRLYDEYEKDLKIYNNLVAEYNRKIQ